MKSALYIFLPLLFLCCSTFRIEDHYKAFRGTAVITGIKDSPYNPDGKNNYSDIFFNFTPDDGNAPAMYKYKKWKDTGVQLSYKSRMNHFKPWIEKMNITTGNRYEAVRYEKKSGLGSAPPVVFKVFLDKRKP